MNLRNMTDTELLTRMGGLVGSEHQLLARLIVCLIEVEERRLDRRHAYTSMMDFCIRHLALSESESYRRVTAARLVRRFPHILEKIARKQIHLSALGLLRDHLTDANHHELVNMACGRTTREVRALLAARFPRPDVPTRIRKLPSVSRSKDETDAAGSSLESTSTSAPVDGSSSSCPPSEPCGTEGGSSSISPGEVVIGGGTASSVTPSGAEAMRASMPSTASARPVLEPLSEARYKLQLTIDENVRAKLERAKRLMSHGNPTGDLGVIIERALDALIADLEKTRLAKTARPRQPTVAKAKPGYVSRAVRREAFARDGEQCTFVDEQGRRCPARSFLELDHIQSRALGGRDDLANIRVRCRAHNSLHAEQVFGREHIERRIRASKRKSIARDAPPAESTATSPDESKASTPARPCARDAGNEESEGAKT